MNKLKFFYSASTMGYYGIGRWWHRFYNFPKLESVTKTITLFPKRGIPFAVFIWKGSVYNSVKLHNMGILSWYCDYQYQYCNDNVVISIAGTDSELELMVELLNSFCPDLCGIELNFSCPNVKGYNNKKIPESSLPLYLKLNHKMDPYGWDLDKIKGIRLNSIPMKCGGGSGAVAKKYNWIFIEKYGKHLNVAGCSFNSMDDINSLVDMGCKEIGIGSVILTNPKLVEEIGGIRVSL